MAGLFKDVDGLRRFVTTAFFPPTPRTTDVTAGRTVATAIRLFSSTPTHTPL